ncbi:hypothetical protein ENU1_044480 [Entamoeba nuttalli P19]|uniref:PPM-type phosphatase domain-containing protein n=1 Tax=Entamoeba nuttalli (strain P19) TaxID=1076696 RepID=K2H2Q0_ENTNP|nr:hypothetical protein ENU1_044480 [Entamoeba nuttalli P19]EKE41798.1 hypothetical protein ENU1_044480 [Entamoeba nuttalli P19]|eukprot:XP_008855874.1 hypothetical protein ENU1_044480 [Entamoeba nuttalli P19]
MNAPSIEHIQKYFSKYFKKMIEGIKEKKIQLIQGDFTKSFQPTFSYTIRSSDEFAMTTFSTYAVVNNKKDGDPVCDKAGVLRYKNAFISCIADGCGWGEKSSKAAISAVSGCLDYLSLSIKMAKTTTDIARILVESFAHAHYNIIKEKQSPMHIGITTLLVTCTIYVENSKKGIKPFTLLLSVGDCRAFYIKMKSKQAISLCGINRTKIKEIQNCSGSLGAANEYFPDLKGSVLLLIKSEIGDKILTVTDGFYDNISCMSEFVFPLIDRSATLADFLESFSKLLIDITEPIRKEVVTTRKLIISKGKLDHSTSIIYDIVSQYSLNPINTFYPSIFDSLIPNKKRVSSLPKALELKGPNQTDLTDLLSPPSTCFSSVLPFPFSVPISSPTPSPSICSQIVRLDTSPSNDSLLRKKSPIPFLAPTAFKRHSVNQLLHQSHFVQTKNVDVHSFASTPVEHPSSPFARFFLEEVN